MNVQTPDISTVAVLDQRVLRYAGKSLTVVLHRRLEVENGQVIFDAPRVVHQLLAVQPP